MVVTSAALLPSAVMPKGDKDAIMNSIVDSYRTHSKDHRRKKYRKTKKIRKCHHIPPHKPHFVSVSCDCSVRLHFTTLVKLDATFYTR